MGCTIDIRWCDHDKPQICRRILENLPDWFGIPESIDRYVEQAAAQPMLVAFAGNQAIGFLTPGPIAGGEIDIIVIAVEKSWHRQGIGKRLIEEVSRYASAMQCRALKVLTLSSASPDQNYKKTREFYAAMGFEPLAELPELWSPEDPALLMRKSLLPIPA